MPGSQPVPRWVQPAALLQHRVADPVSGSHGQQWCDAAAFLLGECVEPVIAAAPILACADATVHYYFVYSPSPGAQVLWFDVSLYPSNVATGADATVTVDLAGALNGAAWIDAGGLDGSAPLMSYGLDGLTSYGNHRGFLDISACAKGTPDVVHITLVDTAGFSNGIARLTVQEAPLAALDPAASATLEAGIDPDWPSHANRGELVDGTGASGPRGAYRVFKTLDDARSKVRGHLQLLRPAVVAADTWQVAGTTFANPLGAGAVFHTMARRLYDAATPNAHRAWVTYQTSGAADAELRVSTDTVPVTSTTTATLTLPGTSGAWSTIDAGAVDIPTGGTDQEALVEFAARSTDAAQTVYFAHVALVEDES